MSWTVAYPVCHLKTGPDKWRSPPITSDVLGKRMRTRWHALVLRDARPPVLHLYVAVRWRCCWLRKRHDVRSATVCCVPRYGAGHARTS